MSKSLTKRELVILYITVFIILLSIIINQLILPAVRKNRLLNAQIHITKTKILKYLTLLKQKKQLLSAEKKFINPADKNASQETNVSIFSEIEKIALDSSIKIIDIRPQPIQEGSRYQEMLIELKTEGELLSYIKFIYNLEHSLTLFKVTKFQLNSQPDTQALEGHFTISKLLL